MAVAGKACDELIDLHNLKIKASTLDDVASLNDEIHGILDRSRGWILADTEKAHSTHIAIHAAVTTPGAAVEILLDKVFTDANLKHLDTSSQALRLLLTMLI